MESNLYSKIAEHVRDQIRHGLFDAGDKLPSVRTLAKQQQVSIATVNSAYTLLESRGLIESRPKSGYYVLRTTEDKLKQPTQIRSLPKPRPANISQLIMQVQRDAAARNGLTMSSAIPNLDFPIVGLMKKTFTRIARQRGYLGNGYDSPEGLPAFRQQIARRAIDAGVYVSPDEIITTAGCQNAMALCLQVLTKPGDIVAVESPAYYGLLQLIQAYGLRAMEIPSNPQTGMSLEALKLALHEWPVKAVMTVGTFSNPMGTLMPDEHKRELVALLERHDVALVEDDIYGELQFGEVRPKAIKAYDTGGRVLLCSSLSKTVDPQLRLGWVMPGRYLDQITHQKFVNSIASPTLPQLVMTEILSMGAFDKHLRLARETYRQRFERLTELVNEHFPPETRMSKPQGGLVAWLELPKIVDATALYHKAHDHGILFAPGEMFSVSGHYRNCLRLSYAQGWSREREQAIALLGHWVSELARSPSHSAA
ncbi:PLP-dependent aminotransferase family protein [Allohahella marinimesophila]|uniref:PLP-dependent aminotransferase family protein n=1 Tax=Allohahella marinimesophila TaxID=1054972 RepID=A0ABP7PBM5_9GAMM